MQLATIEAFLAREHDAVPTPGAPAYQSWRAMTDAHAFLVKTASETIPVYISQNGFFLYGLFVPRRKFGKRYVSDLLKWNFSVSSGWGYSYSFSPDTGISSASAEPPLTGTGARTLEGSEPVFFHRTIFHTGAPSYLEIHQRFAHLTDIHWQPDQSAYCRADEHGDLVPVATVRSTDDRSLCTVTQDALEIYLFLTDSVLVRVFEVFRCHDLHEFSASARSRKRLDDTDHDIHAEHIIMRGSDGNDTSILRGFQIIRRQQTEETMLRRLSGEPEQPRRYVTFRAFDFKHERVTECSCDPKELGNYFVLSNKPYSTSPAFFRSEVISRYKQNPDKYSIEDRFISCRGTWDLRYDVNEAGQIHAYLIDLSRLPYPEQVYWQSFNEDPRADISERTLASDFKAEWDTFDNPLESLKQRLTTFPKVVQQGLEMEVWQLSREARARGYSRLAYVLTRSTKEWEDQVLALAQVLVEGLNKARLRALAKHLNCDDPQIGSLKLLRRTLVARGVDQKVIEECVKPLEELQGWRSKAAAHGGGSVPTGDLRKHYRGLVERCDKAMERLAELVNAHVLDIP